MTGIKNIVFDLGGVLLNLDFNATIHAFENLGLDRAVMDKRTGYADKIFYELELGLTTPEKFRTRIREILENPSLTDKNIDDAWCAMILDIPPERVNMLRKLKSDYHIFLFSNTNKIHIDKLHKWFIGNYGYHFSSLFDKDIYSHDIHERKPDLNSFRKLIKVTGIDPSESVFIDDLEKNTMAADQSGFKTIWLKEGDEVISLFSIRQ